MVRKTERERVVEWQRRLDASEKVYQKWEDRYQTKILWEYYLGHQWRNENESGDKFRYVINLIFPTIETQLPSQLFYHPNYIVRPSPMMEKTPGSNAGYRALLQQETLNAFIRDERLGFKAETFLALLESYFRFGVLEVGYSADWIDNPNAGKPLLKENSDEFVVDKEGKGVLSPERIVKRERIYFKRIPASQFRVSVNASNQLNHCDWCAYYEWHYPEDLKRNLRYKNTTNIQSTGRMKEEASANTYENAGQQSAHRDMVKVWKLYDRRAGKRFDFSEGGEKFFLEEDLDRWEDETPVLPFAILMKHPCFDEFYPLPPVYNWISPQDELNETREGQKIHRRRFLRKFIADPSIPEEELEKWKQPADGLVIRGKVDGIQPIQDAPLDPTVVRNIPQTKEDFREISGVSGEDRGIAESETATQANIINVESRIRETKAKDQIADWLSLIGKLALYYVRKRMILPFAIRMNTDTLAVGAQQAALDVSRAYEEIKAEDLDGVDTEVTVDITSLAPINEAQERQDWIQALQIVADPLRGPMILANEVLLRKTMSLFNIRNEKEITAMRDFGVQAIQMMIQQTPARGAPTQGGTPGPGPTPTNQEIAEQLQRQLPMQ